MMRAVLYACWPWLVVLLASLAVAYLLARANRGRIHLARLRELHHDELGGVQSLSFVLTLPLFIMVMMLIVQVSQLMIGVIVVHYAAYASARSALVWIPAAMPFPEGPNCIASYQLDPDAGDQTLPVVDPNDPQYGPGQGGGVSYVIDSGSDKYNKIASAAVMACMTISPSRDVGYEVPQGEVGLDALDSAYQALATQSKAPGAVPRRLQNKLAYSMANTKVEIRFFHRNDEPPLVVYQLLDDPGEFYSNEIGWQDPLTVTVKHDLALLPGLAGSWRGMCPGWAAPPDRVSETIKKNDQVYQYPLKASATVGNEGEKSVVSYGYHAY